MVIAVQRALTQLGYSAGSVDGVMGPATRRAILARLSEGDATVNELAAPFPMTTQAISKHLKVLERAGLIVRGRSAQLRPSRLQGTALKEVADWVAEYRSHWDESFDRLDEHLSA